MCGGRRFAGSMEARTCCNFDRTRPSMEVLPPDPSVNIPESTAPPLTPAPHPRSTVLYGPDGLRAGWSLVIYIRGSGCAAVSCWIGDAMARPAPASKHARNSGHRLSPCSRHLVGSQRPARTAARNRRHGTAGTSAHCGLRACRVRSGAAISDSAWSAASCSSHCWSAS